MTKIKTIIVDDEKEAREGVELLLEKDEEIDLVAVCKNGVEAIAEINSLSPDLVYLDIQMPAVNGFEVINSLEVPVLPAIIFTTAYDQYTLKAFEVHAVDYLLKPFTDERFYSSLNFAKSRIKSEKLIETNQELRELAKKNIAGSAQKNSLWIKEKTDNKKIKHDKLVVKTDGRVYFLPLNEIIWLEAFDYYIKIHWKNRYFVVRDSLKNMEDTLPESHFFRIHKSSIVNSQFINQFISISGSEFEVVLTNGQHLKVSRHFKNNLKGFI